MRRFLAPVAALVVTAVTAVVAVAGGQVANAARLQVRAGQMSVADAGNPCAGVTLQVSAEPVTGSASAVSVTTPAGWPSACAGKTVDVVVSDGAVTRVGSIPAAPAAGATMPVALDAAFTPSPTGVTTAATVGGWQVATTWSYAPAPPAVIGPVTPGTTTTDLRSVTWPLVNVGQQFCVDVTVSTTNPNGQEEWAVDLNIDQRPFNGATSGYQISGPDAWKVLFRSAVPQDGKLTIIGSGTYKKLRAGDPALSFTVCHYGTPAPVYDPALTYTVVQGPVTGTASTACVTSAVSVTGTPTFYAGWRADIDLSAAVALVSTPPNTFEGVFAADDSYRLEALGGNVWRVSGSHWGNYGLRDGMVREVTLCAQ